MPFEINFILWLQSLGGEGSLLYYLLTFFTLFGEEMLLVGIMVTVYFGIDKKRGEKLAATLMACLLIFPMVKNIVKRTRPFDADDRVLNLRDVDGYSFPSGHTISATAMLAGTAKQFGSKRKWLWIIAIVVPLFVALSRNYLGAHFLTDVLTSLVIGYGVVFLMPLLLEKFKPIYIYLAMIAIGFVGMFYCTTEDYFTSYGLVIGFAIGVTIEKNFVKFENTRVWWRIVLRIIGAGVLYLGLNMLIKMPFEGIIYSSEDVIKDNMIIFERIFRTVRYAILDAVILGVYPLLFKRCEKLWYKLGWLKQVSNKTATEVAE